MHPDEFLGPDGLNSSFYQHFWGDLEEELFDSASSQLNSGAFPSHLNDTHIVLAPKCDHPETIKTFTIFLYAMSFTKLSPKVLANRLRPMIGNFISPEQVAFVPTRSIMDNALSAFELLIYEIQA